MCPAIVSIVNKGTKESCTEPQMSSKHCRKPQSSDTSLMYVSRQDESKQWLSTTSGSKLLLRVGGFQILTLCNYKRSFSVLFKGRERMSEGPCLVQPVEDQAFTQIDLPHSGSRSVYSQCTVCSQLSVSAGPTSMGSTNRRSKIFENNLQKVPKCKI